MREREDLPEFFQLFEHTQCARNNPRAAWAATLLPLLNPTCKSLALSLPATARADYIALKEELLALAKVQTDQASKLFWERKKPLASTWREEVAELTKLIRRCAPGPSAEEVREQILVVQMLPRTIQAFVRERKPTKPSEAADLISTYFRAHGITETEWELRDREQYNKKAGYKQSYSHQSYQPQHNNRYTMTTTQQQTSMTPSTTTPTSSTGQEQSGKSYKGRSFPQKGYHKRDMSKVQCHNCKEYGHYAYQCVKVNVVTLPGLDGAHKKPPVMKHGKIGHKEHLWYMDSGADMCFIAEDLLPEDYTDCPPVHAP